MKKNNIISRHSSPLALAEGYILAKTPNDFTPLMKSFPLMSALLLMNMLEKIQSRLEHLSKSERKVAEVILATPEQAIHSSIAALALEAGVSEPTVNRFCRSLETPRIP
ncbi:phosphogluconate repressor HexR, RpiR family [Klebsiella pneumoniae subsp. rhinoscleromatis]|nr:phosphogluconate repressor HexR, RpiR family [Klebsiella pneumoniae subsp. rhinoscleromatis]